MLSASAAAGVSPVLLEHPVVAAEGLVEFRAVAGSLSDAEIEIALISVFLACRRTMRSDQGRRCLLQFHATTYWPCHLRRYLRWDWWFGFRSRRGTDPRYP